MSAPRPVPVPASTTTGMWPGGPADSGDLAAFLGRAVALDPAAVARVRAAGDRVTAYVRLPFGVLVSRTVAGVAEPADVTVGAADLVDALDAVQSTLGTPPVGTSDAGASAVGTSDAGGPAVGTSDAGAPGGIVVDPAGASAGSTPGGGRGGVVAWPVRRDMEWRAALPPSDGWLRLDAVPGEVVRTLVRAGRDALRAVPAGAAAAAGESLLDHESLTVSGSGRTAALPLRVLSALTRMGFLGGDPAADLVLVSAAGGWVRLAAAYGSAYQHTAPGLGLSPR